MASPRTSLGLATAVAVVRLLPSGATTLPSTPATAGAGTDARLRLAATLAVGHDSDGGQTDRSCLDDDRTVLLSRSASFPGTLPTRERLYPSFEETYHGS
jgi:hypothetical protein